METRMKVLQGTRQSIPRESKALRFILIFWVYFEEVTYRRTTILILFILLPQLLCHFFMDNNQKVIFIRERIVYVD
jgi:hypothetical protein